MDGCSAIIFVKHVKSVFVQVLLCCFAVKARANAIMQRKQRQLGQKQFWHVLPNWLLCNHPWPNMNEQCYQMKVEYLVCYNALKLVVLYLFSILRNLESNRVSFFFYNSHCIVYMYTTGWVYTGGPPKKKNSRYSWFFRTCSDQQLSFFTLLNRASFPHYNTNHQIWLRTFYFMSNFLWTVIFGICPISRVPRHD